MARPHILDENPDLVQQLVELLADGTPARAIADTFGVHPRTIGEWKKRADVKARLSQHIRERADSILSHTDTRIRKVLESGKDLTMRELLEIRRTFAGEKVDLNLGGNQGEALAEMMEKLHDNPELARELGALTADAAE